MPVQPSDCAISFMPCTNPSTLPASVYASVTHASAAVWITESDSRSFTVHVSPSSMFASVSPVPQT